MRDFLASGAVLSVFMLSTHLQYGFLPAWGLAAGSDHPSPGTCASTDITRGGLFVYPQKAVLLLAFKALNIVRSETVIGYSERYIFSMALLSTLTHIALKTKN